MRDTRTSDSDLTFNSSQRESGRESLYERVTGRDCLERVHRRL
jgi:hypothetical protein